MADELKSRVEGIADTVEKIADETAAAVESVKEEVKVLAQSYQKDVKDLQEALKGGAKFDKAEAEKIVSDLLDKQKNDEATKRVLSGNASAANKAMTDPWDAKADYFAWDVKSTDGKDYKPLLEAALRASARGEAHKEFQHMATDVMIANALANSWARMASEPYDPKGGGFAKFFPKMSKKWAEHQARFISEFTGKATVAPMDLAEQSTWVPVAASPEVRELIMLKTGVGSLFEHLRYTGAGTNYDLPVDLTDTVADYITETTAYSSTSLPYVAQDPIQLGHALVDAKCTFAFKKHRGRFIFTGELDEDSIVPILPRVRMKLVETMAHGEEDAWINGQLSASIDTGAAAPGTYSIRKAHNGLRYFCSSGVVNSLFDAGSDNLAYSDIMAARAVMGERGVDPADLALILGPAGYMQALKITEVKTVDVYGPAATVATGELAKISGIPIVVSRFVPEDMNVSGIRDATTTTQTIAIVVNRRGWLACEKRDITIESVRLPSVDWTDVIAMRRMDLESLYGYATSGTPKTACVIYNLDTALA